MKTIWLFLLWMAVASPAAFADTCTGAETQLKTISKDLARNAVTAAESLLAPLETAYPDCAQLLLARARIKAAQGSSAEAQDLFLRYMARVPDDSTGMAYFARFLIDQRTPFQKLAGLLNTADVARLIAGPPVIEIDRNISSA